MTWSRGFLRLWLALSACYVVTVVWAIGLDSFRPLARPSPVYDIEFSGGTVYSFDTSKSHEELRRDVSAAWRADAAALVKAGKRADAQTILVNLEKNSDDIMRTMRSGNETRRDQAYRAVAITVGPPAFLLALGCLVGWIASGFRRAPSP
jgi:hypothetical protein